MDFTGDIRVKELFTGTTEQELSVKLVNCIYSFTLTVLTHAVH